MGLFDKLIKKPLRWAASSIAGKKGRDAIDKYAPLIEEASGIFLPLLKDYDTPDLIHAVEEWAKSRGVEQADIDTFIGRVLGVKA